MSIAKINDDDKKRKQITNSAPGYKIKHAKLIPKFNNSVDSISQQGTDDNNGKSRYPKSSSKEKGFDANYDSINNIVFHKSITERTRRRVGEFLKELNIKQDNKSTVKIYINRNNIDEFIYTLRELIKEGITFGKESPGIKDVMGENIDFRA
jgi:lipopolysaccharide export LptBFGC system permease protein LptF